MTFQLALDIFSMIKDLSILFVDNVIFVHFILKPLPSFLKVLEFKVLFQVK